MSIALHGGSFVSSLCCLVIRDFEALGADIRFYLHGLVDLGHRLQNL